MNDTPTPRTDASFFSATCEKPKSGDYELKVVYADFTRQLERELAAANAALAEQTASHGQTVGIVSDAFRERDTALAQLATRTQTEAGLREQVRVLVRGLEVARDCLRPTQWQFDVVKAALEFVPPLTPEAIAGELSELREKAKRALPAELTPDLREILGMMIYSTAPIAHAFQKAGAKIEQKAEEEQAFILFWLLGLYLKHGSEWRKHAAQEIPRADEARKAGAQ